MMEDSGGECHRGACKKLWQVQLGMPKHKQFLRLMENGTYRKNFDKFDLEMNSELLRNERYLIKEELYYCLDEKDNQIDLTELGCTHFNHDENAFILPDLPLVFSQIDGTIL